MVNGLWTEEQDLDMVNGQCVFVDNFIVLDEDNNPTFIPTVSWLNKNKFTYLKSDPNFVVNRPLIIPIPEQEHAIDTNSTDEIRYQLSTPIDDVDNIKSIRIRGSFTYKAFDLNETQDDLLEYTFTIPFNFNSIHGESLYRYDDLNVRRMFIGLDYNPLYAGSEDDTLNEIYFLHEYVGYVKSINTLKNYTPFYLPKEVYSTGFTKGIKLGVSPTSGTGNVLLGWNFSPIISKDAGISKTPIQPDTIERTMQVKGEIIVEYNE